MIAIRSGGGFAEVAVLTSGHMRATLGKYMVIDPSLGAHGS